jgi:hypothetical protein
MFVHAIQRVIEDGSDDRDLPRLVNEAKVGKPGAFAGSPDRSNTACTDGRGALPPITTKPMTSRRTS